VRVQHVTLMTGDCVLHRLDVLDAGAVAACARLLPGGGQVPGFAAFRVEIHGPVFTIFRGREPLVMCGIGRGEDDTWRSLVALQECFAPVTAVVPGGLWLAVVLLPHLMALAQADVMWLGDFERCLAAALLETGLTGFGEN